MNRAEEIKIDNYKAQLNSILGRISDENKNLEDLLTRKSQIESFIESLGGYEEKYKKIVDDIRIASEEREIILESYRKQEKDVIESIANANKQLNAAISEEGSIKSNIDSLTVEVERLTDKVGKLTGECDSLEAKLAELEEATEQAADNLSECLNELESVKITLDESKKESAKEKSKARKELEEIRETIAEERKKSGAPIKAIEEREFQLGKRERDLRTLISRFKKHHKKLFPNQEIKI